MRSLMAAALAGALLAAPAQAATPMSAQTVVIPADQVIDDDVYAWGNTIRVHGRINGDLVAAGGTVEVLGPVDGDIIVAGGTVQLSGPVGGSVRAAGGQITVSAPVRDDFVVTGGEITLMPAGRVGRDVLLAGSTATLQGGIGRSVRAAGELLTLSGPVGGDVRVSADALLVTDDARIGGDLAYTVEQDAQIAPGAEIAGIIEPSRARERQPDVLSAVGGALIAWARGVIALTALGLLLVWLLPRFTSRTLTTLRQRPGPSVGVGFGLLIGVPATAFLVLLIGLLVGGWWLSALLVALYGLLVALALDVSGLWLGRLLLDRAGRPETSPGWALILGLAILLLIGLVPVIGALVLLAAVLVGTGALALAMARARQATLHGAT